jgi:hypothetical protein
MESNADNTVDLRMMLPTDVAAQREQDSTESIGEAFLRRTVPAGSVAQATAKHYNLRKMVIRGQGAERSTRKQKIPQKKFKYDKRNLRVRANMSLQNRGDFMSGMKAR